MKNIIKTCPTCGQKIQQTKFTKLYGSTLKELGKRFHCHPSTIWMWHKKGKLAHKFLARSYSQTAGRIAAQK